MYCPSCGANIEQGTQFCPSCGGPLGMSGPPKAKPGPPVAEPVEGGYGLKPEGPHPQTYEPPPAFGPPQSGYGPPPGAGGTSPFVPNNLIWAILSTLCCCLPFGIVSIVYAAQVNGKLRAGDYAGAVEASENAKKWAWISFGIGLGVNVIAVLIEVFAALTQGM